MLSEDDIDEKKGGDEKHGLMTLREVAFFEISKMKWVSCFSSGRQPD
jgi:hypothetical protein